MCARLTAALVVLALGSSQAVRGVSLLAQPDPVAAPLWTVTEGMDSPESVYFDAASGFLFVSQIGGQAAERDGDGRISKLTVEGKLVDANWVSGLNAPKGLRAYQKTLWAADIDEVVASTSPRLASRRASRSPVPHSRMIWRRHPMGRCTRLTRFRTASIWRGTARRPC